MDFKNLYDNMDQTPTYGNSKQLTEETKLVLTMRTSAAKLPVTNEFNIGTTSSDQQTRTDIPTS